MQRFIARRVSDPHLAADLTADVFVAAIQSAHKYKPDRGSPAAWLIGVARNVVNAEFRRAAKNRAVTRLVSGRELLDADSLADIEARIDAERAAREIYNAVRQLPAKDRALVELIAVVRPELRPLAWLVTNDPPPRNISLAKKPKAKPKKAPCGASNATSLAASITSSTSPQTPPTHARKPQTANFS